MPNSSRDIKEGYLKLQKQVKDFLLSKNSREFFIFLFFVLVASGFWLLQTLNEEYEAEYSLQVRLKNIPDNVVITTEPSSQLQIKLKDKGNVLLNYMISKNFFPLNLDFSDYKSQNNHIRIPTYEFEKRIQTQLNASTRLLSIKPDTLEYIYATGNSKAIPIKVNGKISSARQYYISDTIFSPDSVLVYAPSSILDTLSTAYTEIFSLNDISDTAKYQAAIQPIKGAKFIPDQVELTFPVDIYTEKTVEVPITGIQFPSNKALRTFPSKIQVTFQVGLSRFKEVDSDDFAVEVSYYDLAKASSDKFPAQLTTSPKGISNIRITPKEVDFLIEQLNQDD